MSECLCFCMCEGWCRERDEKEERLDVEFLHIVKIAGFHVIAERKMRDIYFC